MTMKEMIQNFTGLFTHSSTFSFLTSFYILLSVFHRGSALQKRNRDREKEVELDERDRKREKEELEEIRQRLLAEGHPDPDAELQRVGDSSIHLGPGHGGPGPLVLPVAQGCGDGLLCGGRLL